MSSSNKIILTSHDNETFEVDEAVAREFQIVAHMIEDNCADKPIPITNVSGKILSKVIEFCKKQVEQPPQDEETKKTWNKEFIALDEKELFELILAANYLNVKNLIDLTSQAIADIIKDKEPEDIRTIFNIENDYTPEEEAQIREENKWAFEP